MHVAVTGSTGLIGSNVVDALERRGDTVRRIVRSRPQADEVWWDPVSGGIDATGLEGVAAVVHLAGEPIASKRWNDEQKQRIRDSRLLGTDLLAQTLARLDRKPEVLVTGSAIGYYGDRGDELLTEKSEPGSGFLANVVRSWEESAQAASDAGIRVVFIRSGLVLSADGGALKEQLPFFKLGIGGRIGDGTQFWSWISIDDEVGAILHLIDNEVHGAVNLVAPNPVTNGAFTKALGRALRRPTFVPTPKAALTVRLGKELTEQLTLASTRVSPRVLIDTGYSFRHEIVDEAFEDLL